MLNEFLLQKAYERHFCTYSADEKWRFSEKAKLLLYSIGVTNVQMSATERCLNTVQL